MRNGILVEEGNPRDILIKYNTESLESAFLTLCYDQDSNKVLVILFIKTNKSFSY